MTESPLGLRIGRALEGHWSETLGWVPTDRAGLARIADAVEAVGAAPGVCLICKEYNWVRTRSRRVADYAASVRGAKLLRCCGESMRMRGGDILSESRCGTCHQRTVWAMPCYYYERCLLCDQYSCEHITRHGGRLQYEGRSASCGCVQDGPLRVRFNRKLGRYERKYLVGVHDVPRYVRCSPLAAAAAAALLGRRAELACSCPSSF